MFIKSDPTNESKYSPALLLRRCFHVWYLNIIVSVNSFFPNIQTIPNKRNVVHPYTSFDLTWRFTCLDKYLGAKGYPCIHPLSVSKLY